MFFKKNKKDGAVFHKRKVARSIVYIPAVMYVLSNQYEKSHLDHLVKRHKLVGHRGVIINISPKGMLLLKLPSDISHANQPPVANKSLVSLKFHLPILMNEISINGSIVHMQKKDEDFPEVSLIGIEFAKVSFMDIVSLEEYIHTDMEDLAPNARNKRKFARLKTDRPVRMSDARKRVFKDQKGTISDISASGIQMVFDSAEISASSYEKLKSGEISSLFVKFTVSAGGRWISALCDICRVELVEGFVHIGLKFLEISEKDQLTVLKYVALRREKLLGEE